MLAGHFHLLPLPLFTIFRRRVYRKKIDHYVYGIFWGFRLSSYLAVRVLSHGEDARYTAFRKDYGDAVDRKFLQIYFSFKVYSTLSFRFHFLLFVQIQILTFIRLNI